MYSAARLATRGVLLGCHALVARAAHSVFADPVSSVKAKRETRSA